MNPPLILASSSPRRRELLSSLGLEFTIIKPDIDESQHPGEAPLDYVRRLSQEKARDVVVRLHSPVAVLAADTVVILAADTLGVGEAGEILGKPVDDDDARWMLRRLRGRTHQVYTALTVYRMYDMTNSTPIEQQMTDITRTDVYVREYGEAEIGAYITTGDPFDKAGSYAIQHEAFHPVARIEGCYSNVVGLPVCGVRRALAAVGWLGMDPGGVRLREVVASIEQEGAMASAWMWANNYGVQGVRINPYTRRLNWYDDPGCACGDNSQEQTVEDFLKNGPLYGSPPEDVLAEMRATLQATLRTL